jgi:hypothetical protein
MRVIRLEKEHARAVARLYRQTMAWAPPTTASQILERQLHGPQGQFVAIERGEVVGYGWILRRRAGELDHTWFGDTGGGVGEVTDSRPNVAYVGSTLWKPTASLAVRALLNGYREQAAHWGVAQIMGCSRIPALAGALTAGAIRREDVHDFVLDGLDQLTRVYWGLGFQPAVPQPGYSSHDHDSMGYGMLMVSRP